MKTTLLSTLLIFCFSIPTSIAQKYILQDVNYEINCAVDIHVDGDNIYAAISRNSIQIFENNVWSEKIQLLDGFTTYGDITKDDNGIIWYVSSDGLFSYDDGDIVHYTEDNSDLPENRLNSIHAVGDTLWMTESGTKLIKKVGDQFEVVPVFTGSNAFIRASEVLNDGRLIVSSFNKFAVLEGDSITTTSLNGFITDFFTDNAGDIMITTDRGLYKFLPATDEIIEIFTNSAYEYVASGIDPEGNIYTIADGNELIVIDSSGIQYPIDSWDIEKPNFDNFFMFKDTLRAYGSNINVGGNTEICTVITSLTGIVSDDDNDGFFSNVDCDDNEDTAYPGATEIANNDIDEDCDGELLIIDVDADGFNSDEDCDDDNPDIYPGAAEIANNDIDEDCDGEDLITISTHELSININIYPNPATDKIMINGLDDTKIKTLKIIDARGIIHSQFDINTSKELNIQDLIPGLYHLIIADDSSTIIGRKSFIKE